MIRHGPYPRAAIAWVAIAGVIPAALAFRWPVLGWVVLVVDALLVVGSVIDRRILARLELMAVRRLPAWVSRNRPFRLDLLLANASRRGLRMTVVDHLVTSIQPRDAEIPVVLGPGESAAVPRQLVAQRRGRHRLPPLQARLTAPLLQSWSRWEGQEDELRVLPDLRLLGRYDDLLRQQRLREMGVRSIRRRGFGTDLAGLRQYVAGDPFSRIDWKATARRGRPVVREHEAERHQPLLLLLDTGRRMAREVDGAHSRLDEAIEAVLLLSHVALGSSDRVGLYAFADAPLRRVAVDRGPLQMQRLARAVYDLEPVLREPRYQEIAAEVQRQQSRRSLIVLFTDVLEPTSLRQLAGPLRFLGQRHLCICALFQDLSLKEALEKPPSDEPDLYRAGAAASLWRERQSGLMALRAAGALVLEVRPGELSTEVVNEYLRVKAGQLL
jgi:uncharacterized protein (DUF58 family)